MTDDADRSVFAADPLGLDHTYRLLADYAGYAVAGISGDAVLTWVSESISGLAGWLPDQLQGKPFAEFVHPEDLPNVPLMMSSALTGTRDTFEFRLLCADGSYKWRAALCLSVPEDDVVASHTQLLLALRDAEDEVAARHALARSERQFRLAMDGAPEGIAVVALHLRFMQVNEKLSHMLGRSSAELLELTLEDVMYPDDLEADRDLRDLLISGAAEHLVGERRLLTATGRIVWVNHSIGLLRDEHGMPLFYVSQLQDITEERAAREALAQSERMFRLAMDGAPLGMAVVGLRLEFLQVNEKLCQMLGRDPEWLLGRTVGDVMHEDDRMGDLAARATLIAGETDHVVDERLLMNSDGKTVWTLHSVGLLRDDSGEPIFYVSQFQDITQDRENRAQLAYQTQHDLLTGLLNREKVLKRMDVMFDRKPRTGQHIGLLYCDLDNFKSINDTYGTEVGDEVLKTVADRLRSFVRSQDIVARLGDDEFIVVLDGIHGEEDARTVADKIRAAVARPITIDGDWQRPPTMSVGIAVALPGDDATATMRLADLSLQQAKAQLRASR